MRDIITTRTRDIILYNLNQRLIEMFIAKQITHLVSYNVIKMYDATICLKKALYDNREGLFDEVDD